MKYGSIVMMKIPKPKPVVRCTKLAPMLNMNMAIRMLLISSLFPHDRHVGSLPRDDATTRAMFARERRSRERYNCCVAEDADLPVGSFFEED